MKYLTDLGLYFHIPFCSHKCAYCNFYSVFDNKTLRNEYLSALIRETKRWGGLIDRPFDTLYLGGGTPSLLNKDISCLLDAAFSSFDFKKDSEITTEVNPEVSEEFLYYAKKSGVNRISIGIQSATDSELKILGRTHTAKQAEDAVKRIKDAGFKNISADLMICLPNSNIEKLKENLDFFISLDIPHISSYMLKIEENTKFSLFKPDVLDDDLQAEQYLFMCNYLEKHGYSHYEISNFAKKGFESRHNIKYWSNTEYLGIGPSAHSYIDGNRFYYENDIKKFINNAKTVFESKGGELKERIMLSLRLKKGFDFEKFYCDKLKSEFRLLKENGLIEIENTRILLTDKGMLVSNQIIERIIEIIYEDL